MTETSRTWFTADWHLEHELMREKRGYPNLRAMSEGLEASFNSVVRRQDRTFHLGDFTYRGDLRRAAAVLSRLNGSHFLVIGNHDGEALTMKWAGVPAHVMMIKDAGERFFLAHYAHRTWNGYYKGVTHLYGHSHGRIPADDRSCDVGVDAWGMMPCSIPQIKARLAISPPHENPEDRDRTDTKSENDRELKY